MVDTGWGRGTWSSGPWGEGFVVELTGVSAAGVTGDITTATDADIVYITGQFVGTAIGDLIAMQNATVTLTGLSASMLPSNILVWGLVPPPPEATWTIVPNGPVGGWAQVPAAPDTGWTPVVT